MKKFSWKKEILLWLVMAVPFIYCAFVWNQLPEKIPMHFGLSGTANDWQAKGTIWMTPLINIEFYIAFWVITWTALKNFEEKTLYRIRFVLTILLAAITFGLIQMTLNQLP